MNRTTALALIALGFLAAAVACFLNDHENAGFGCFVATFVFACEIPEKEEE